MNELNDNYIEILKNSFDSLCIKYDDQVLMKIKKIIDYANYVIEFNSHTNITGSKSVEDFIKHHIIDCLAAHRFFANAKTVLDVGSGSGVPGIPLSIIYDDIEFTLCESKKKKCNFLFAVKEKFSLSNITVLDKNVYEIKNKYDVITARAFSNMKTLIKVYNHLKKQDSKLVSYKGKIETINEEIKSLPKNIDIDIIPLEHDFLNRQRHILIYKS